MLLRAIKNGNAMLLFDYGLLIWFTGVLIQEFRGTHWSFLFWGFYTFLWVLIPVAAVVIIASIALGIEEKVLRASE